MLLSMLSSFVCFFFGRGDAVRFRSIASNASVASWGGTEIDLGRREADAGLAIAGGIGHLGEGFPGGLVIIGILAFPGVLVGQVGSIQSACCRFTIVLEYPCGL